MPEPSKMNLEAKLYFNSLPPVLQDVYKRQHHARDNAGNGHQRQHDKVEQEDQRFGGNHAEYPLHQHIAGSEQQLSLIHISPS